MRTALTDSAREEDLRRLLHAHDLKKYTLLSTVGLAWKSIGVIYGDVGTSPLYTIPSIFQDNVPVTQQSIYGVTALMVWSLTLILVIKYAVIVLRANDNGEGGTFALYSLLCRELGISPNQTGQGTNEIKSIQVRKIKAQSHQLRSSGVIVNAYSASPIRRWIRQSVSSQFVLMALCTMAVGLVIGDGVLTPAISIMSAVSGISGVTPGDVVGISILILFLLFAAQSFGTSKVGAAFAPILLIWLISIAAIGVYNLCEHGWGIWAALNPAQIVYYFQINGRHGWISLGGVILTVSGTEALYADLGHFSVPAIQLSCLGFVYPCLIFSYLGQLSYLNANPSAVSNLFWACIPSAGGPLYWYMVVLSTLATIVASQSLITAVFSIVRQAVSLGLLPPLHVIHTGLKVEGQVYVPLVNWTLCLLCIAVVAGFQNANALANAFGLAVSAVMFLTTLLVTLHMVVGWELHWALIVLFSLFYLFIEGAMLSANCFKIPQGGWFTLAVGGAVIVLMWVWWLGNSRLKRVLMSAAMKPRDFFRVVSLYEDMLEETPHLLMEEQSHPPQRISINRSEVAGRTSLGGRLSIGFGDVAAGSAGRSSIRFGDITASGAGEPSVGTADSAAVWPGRSSVGLADSVARRSSIGITDSTAGGAGRSSIGIADIAARSLRRRSFNLPDGTSLRTHTSLGRHNPANTGDGTIALEASTTVPEDSVLESVRSPRQSEIVGRDRGQPRSPTAAIESASVSRGIGAMSAMMSNVNIACLSAAPAPERPLVVMPGLGVYYSDSQDGIPPVMARFLANIHAVHRVNICLNVWTLPIPAVETQFRLKVTRARNVANFYQVLVRYGYKERVDHGPLFISQLVSAIKDLLHAPDAECETDDHSSDQSKPMPAVGGNVVVEMSGLAHESVHEDGPRAMLVPENWAQVPESMLATYIQDLQTAVEEGVVYYVGRVSVTTPEDEPWTWSCSSLLHRVYEPLFALMVSASWAENRGFIIPQEKLIELGMTVELK